MRGLWLGAGMHFLIAMPIAAAVAALCALVVGVPTFRLRGAYFSIGTLALAEALRLTIANVLPIVSRMPARLIAAYDMALCYYVRPGDRVNHHAGDVSAAALALDAGMVGDSRRRRGRAGDWSSIALAQTRRVRHQQLLLRDWPVRPFRFNRSVIIQFGL